MHLLSVAVIIAAFKSKLKTTTIKTILILAGASLLQALVDFLISSYIPFMGKPYITTFSISLYIIIEFTFCFFLVFSSGVSGIQKRLMRISLFLYYSFEVIYLSIVYYQDRHNSLESIIELSFILFFCAIYYYNILCHKPQQHLINNPSFWAISGMAFMALVQMPCAFIVDYILYKKSPYSNLYHVITALVYCTLFICLLKSIRLTKKDKVYE